MSEELDFVGVYYSNTNLKGPPAFSVPREDARGQVNCFMAKWVNKAKAIQMRYTQAEMHKTAESLTMGAHVAAMAAQGVPKYVALVEAYRPRLKFVGASS